MEHFAVELFEGDFVFLEGEFYLLFPLEVLLWHLVLDEGSADLLKVEGLAESRAEFEPEVLSGFGQ